MKRQSVKSMLAVCALIIAYLAPTKAQALTTEQRFQDLFTTAGYATAFGAALGAAALSFREKPENHLRYVAVGASLGFIGGSILGSYIIFTPMISAAPTPDHSPILAHHSDFAIRPHVNVTTRKLTGLEGSWTLAQF